MRNAAPTSTPKFPCRNGRMALSLPIHACLAPAPSDNQGLPFPRAPPWLGTHGERRPWLPIGRQTDDVSDERRHGFMSKGAAGDGRGRSHSNGHSGGGHRLFPHSSVEKERPVGHRAADHDLPACRTPMPALRKPTSIAEGMWGGWTCPTCGCKVDKYGQERTAP